MSEGDFLENLDFVFVFLAHVSSIEELFKSSSSKQRSLDYLTKNMLSLDRQLATHQTHDMALIDPMLFVAGCILLFLRRQAGLAGP